MRYLLFVFFLLVVVLFAHLSHQGTQERLGEQLALASATALQLDSDGTPRDPRFQDVRFEVSNLDVILTGKVATVEARDELVNLIREGTPVGRIRAQKILMSAAREPQLTVALTPGKARLEGRVPTEDLARRVRQTFQGMGVFVSARDLAVDSGVNDEEWLNRTDAVLGRFFAGTSEGEFALGNGVLRLKRSVKDRVDIDLIKAEMTEWVPADRYQVVVDEITVAQAARPVEFSVRKTEGPNAQWMLSGYLPDAVALESITRVLAEADPGSKVDGSGVTIDPSLSRPKWLQNGRIERFLKVFSRTVRNNPEVVIRASGVVLRGTATDFIARSNLPSFASEAFGYGVEIDDEAIQTASQPETGREQWLRFDVNPGSAEVTGAVPSEEAKRGLSGSLERAFPGAKIKDTTLVVDTSLAPMPWLTPLGGFFSELSALTSQKGSLDVSGTKAYLGGIAKSQWSRNALVGKLELALGPEFSVYDQLLVDPRGDGPSTGEATKIYFGLGSHQISQDQQSKIMEAAKRINSGISGMALVKGYASPGGSVAYNVKLSEQRAMAVYEALIAQGVSPKVLKILTEGVDSDLTGEEARRVEIYVR